MDDYVWYRCACCGRQMALTNGARLLFGHGAYTDEPAPLKCSACGRRSYWRPVKKAAQVDSLCYTEAVPA